MAIPHAKPVSATKSSEDIENVEEDEMTMEANGCGCFRIRLAGKNGRSYVVLLEGGPKESSRENCFSKIGKKLKQMKWKVMEDVTRKKMRGMQFRYDMQSYALNFDDGIGREVLLDGILFGFSTELMSNDPVEVG